MGGSFDVISQRIIEFLQAFPDLILAMAISMALGTGHGTVIVAIAVTRIPFGGRIVRAVALSLKEMAYVEAARAIGASPLRIMAQHILPQCVAPYLILATTHLGVAIIIEAARSEEHTSELQSRGHLVCRLLLEKKKTTINQQL